MAKTVYVVYYSLHGRVYKLAKRVVRGLKKAGVNAKLFQVPETLSKKELAKLHAVPKPEDVPIIKASQLAEADGILFGFKTRFGTLPVQMKAFFDQCGQLWMNGALNGKFVGTFFSTGFMGGGEESTALSCMPFFVHMGMLYVPLGAKNKKITKSSEVHGGTNWGAGTIAGGNVSREPSDLELENAEFQGLDFGTIVKSFNKKA